MQPYELLSLILCVAGSFFFLAGTVGLLRFPDVYARLHALTKADNLGLGFVAFGTAIGAETASASFKVLLIWGLALLASTTSCHLVARAARQSNVRPWKKVSP